MDVNQLIDRIVSQVQERVEALEDETWTVSPLPEPVRDNQPKWLIVTQHQEKAEAWLKEQIREAFCPVIFNPDAPQDVSGYEGVLLWTLGCTDMCRIANGTGGTPESDLVVEGLLLGKKMVVLKEGIAYEDYQKSAPVAYYRHFEAAYSRLLADGMSCCPQKDLAACLLQTKPETVVPSVMPEPLEKPVVQENSAAQTDEASCIDKHIITEKDVIDQVHRKVRTIRIPENAIITDMAQELLDDKRIDLCRRS